MFPLFTLTRMAVRAGVLAALIATIMSVASELAVQGEWETVESHAAAALDWLGSLLDRLGGIDPSVGDIRLADLTSPAGWIDLGTGLFGGDVEVSPTDALDVARSTGVLPTGE